MFDSTSSRKIIDAINNDGFQVLNREAAPRGRAANLAAASRFQTNLPGFFPASIMAHEWPSAQAPGSVSMK